MLAALLSAESYTTHTVTKNELKIRFLAHSTKSNGSSDCLFSPFLKQGKCFLSDTSTLQKRLKTNYEDIAQYLHMGKFPEARFNPTHRVFIP